MVRDGDRSRSPPANGALGHAGFCPPRGGSVEDDVLAAHKLREGYEAPKQSLFRVAALLRFVRPDGTGGAIGAVNAEPHDANIRGAICAERAALCQFQRQEAAAGARVTRVVCVTDHASPIFPGPLCREFLTATCAPDVEVVASGTADPKLASVRSLRELLPLPSVYRRRDQSSMKALGATLGAKARPPADADLRAAYEAAAACARQQGAQTAVFPVVFAAAARFADGRVHAVAELKGIEYGCTVDAATLLMPELIRARKEGGPKAMCVVQADQFGLAHAPFAAARSLLVEHGFGDVLLCGHGDDGEWAAAITAQESLPHADFVQIF